MCVEFVVGSCPCSEGLSLLGSPVLSLNKKPVFDMCSIWQVAGRFSWKRHLVLKNLKLLVNDNRAKFQVNSFKRCHVPCFYLWHSQDLEKRIIPHF